MKPEEIKALVCGCRKKNFEDSYRHSITNHILHKPCSKPFESLAKFTCVMCGEPAINPTHFHEFNALRDYNPDGTLKTHLACKECYE